MKKEELVNIISTRLSSQGRETAVAFDVFLRKVAESLDVNESVKIPEVGIFQLKRKGGLSNEETGASAGGKNSFYLLFVPLKYDKKDKDEVLTFHVNPRNIKKNDIDEDVFSLSVDQPLIPVTEQAKREFLVHSSYIMLQKNIEDKAESLLSNSVNLSDFNIDYNLSSIPEESNTASPSNIENETLQEEAEQIPWDFGEDDNLNDNITESTSEEIKEPISEENQDEDFDSIVAEITGEFSEENPAAETSKIDFPEDVPAENAGILKSPDESDASQSAPSQSETEDVLNEILPQDKLKAPDDLFRDLLGEDETSETELPKKLPDFVDNGELGEDWFNLKEVEDDEDEIGVTEETDDDQAKNIDDKLDLLTAMEAGIEIDPFEDFALDEEGETPFEDLNVGEDNDAEMPEEEKPEEELTEEELTEEELTEEEPAEENLQNETLQDDIALAAPKLTDDKMLEDEEEETEHKVKYPGMFWILLGALVLVTCGGVYYFFFTGKKNLTLPDFAKKTPAAEQVVIKPQIIERDYSIPVTVYKRSIEDSSKDVQKEETEPQNTANLSNTNAQNSAPAQNNPAAQKNAAAQNNAPSENKTAPENKVDSKVQNKVDNKQQAVKPPVNNTAAVVNQANKNQAGKTPVTKLPETKPQANKTVEKNKIVEKNKPVENNKPVVKNNAVQNNLGIQDDGSVQPRTDTKNKLIKESIFTDGKGRYTIQESSWQSRAEAVKMVNHFRSKGLDAYFTKYAPKGEKVWYRVRIGDYSSIEEAENTLRKLK